MRTVVHLLRHGEVRNPDKVLYGRLPGFELSELGERMAVMAAEALCGRDVVAIFSSPLERARQTAGPLADKLGLEVVLDDRLVESANVFEGRKAEFGAGSLADPALWPHVWNPFRPSWGEPYADVARRVVAAADEARRAAYGREAVCVSHQLPIWTARRAAEGRRLWHHPARRQCGLASITSFVYDGDELVAIRYSEPAGEVSRKPVPPGA